MMYWFGTDIGGWGYALMIVSMAAFWGLLITAFVVFTRSDDRSESAPENLLAQRFARGEIDEAEFHDRRAALRGGVRL
jgi:putative membrane protein